MDTLLRAPQPRSNQWTPTFDNKLLLAIIAHDVEAVRKELTSGTDPNQSEGHELPLLIACELGDPAIVELLLQHKADPNKRYREVYSHDALSTLCNLTGDPGEEIYQEHLECADLLLKYGADINSTDALKVTALMVATDIENEAFVEWLLEHGADAMAVDQDGWTAMDYSWNAVHDMSGWPIDTDRSYGHNVREMLLKKGCVALKASFTDDSWLKR
jgi:ankyrin repeat protein